MIQKKVKLDVRVSEKIKNDIKEIANKKGISYSDAVRQALYEYIEKNTLK